jgi:hypothetical protein
MDSVFFYKDYNCDKLRAGWDYLQKKLADGPELLLKNGMPVTVFIDEYRCHIYDEDLNLITEICREDAGPAFEFEVVLALRKISSNWD